MEQKTRTTRENGKQRPPTMKEKDTEWKRRMLTIKIEGGRKSKYENCV